MYIKIALISYIYLSIAVQSSGHLFMAEMQIFTFNTYTNNEY